MDMAVLEEDEVGAGARTARDAPGTKAILDVGAVNFDRTQAVLGVGRGEASNAIGPREMPDALSAPDPLARRRTL